MYYRLICTISTIGIVGTQVQLPAMDATCDSIQEKYEHFSWACGPRNCAEGEKSLHNRYLFEKVRCDSEDPSRICCPTFDYQMTKQHSKNVSASSNSSESSKTTISASLPKKEIDKSCSRVTEKYKNRFNWSCQKECTREEKQSKNMDEKVFCDQNDESMICCPQQTRRTVANTTSLPPTLTTLASTTVKEPMTLSPPAFEIQQGMEKPENLPTWHYTNTKGDSKIRFPIMVLGDGYTDQCETWAWSEFLYV